MKSIVALGFFDGVHIGHAALLKRVRTLAVQTGAAPCVLSFDRHPEELITGHEYSLLGTMSDRDELMRDLYGIERVVFAHFDKQLMQMKWDEFILNYVKGELEAIGVVAGHDFHFGHKGEGNPDRLKRLCAGQGLICEIVEKVEFDSITVSSTYIRKLIAQGDMERAGLFLGHLHRISGQVKHGQGIGSSLGVPTINISIPCGVQCPARGVYVTKVTLDGVKYPAVTNLGARPTLVTGGAVWVESTLFGYSGDAYGKNVIIEFIRFLRPEQAFISIDLLKKQINSDILTAREIHGL